MDLLDIVIALTGPAIIVTVVSIESVKKVITDEIDSILQIWPLRKTYKNPK